MFLTPSVEFKTNCKGTGVIGKKRDLCDRIVWDTENDAKISIITSVGVKFYYKGNTVG